jgi:hypothetical protein
MSSKDHDPVYIYFIMYGCPRYISSCMEYILRWLKCFFRTYNLPVSFVATDCTYPISNALHQASAASFNRKNFFPVYQLFHLSQPSTYFALCAPRSPLQSSRPRVTPVSIPRSIGRPWVLRLRPAGSKRRSNKNNRDILRSILIFKFK